tara:strand:- start:287 stop:517 length:231 start_codon:yes stop_codon:yes gene_type:complete
MEKLQLNDGTYYIADEADEVIARLNERIRRFEERHADHNYMLETYTDLIKQWKDRCSHFEWEAEMNNEPAFVKETF